jgi:hypothetical protein
MFKLYFLTNICCRCTVTLNYQLIRNSLEFEFFFFFFIKTRVQILENNIKNWFYKGIGPYKTRSLIYYYNDDLLFKGKFLISKFKP